MPTKAMHKLSKYPRFRKLLSVIKQFRKMSCSACADGKARMAPHSRIKHNVKPGEKISIDTVGPHETSNDNSNTFLTIVDTATRYFTSIPAVSRAITILHIKRVLYKCLHIHVRYPKVPVADNAKEFVGKEITTQFEALGVKLQPIVPHNPKENSINKRTHRTIYEAARSALSHSQLSNKFWGSSVLDATYKYSNLPHSTTGRIPHNEWHHSSRTFKHFLLFGQHGTTVNGTVTNKLSALS